MSNLSQVHVERESLTPALPTGSYAARGPKNETGADVRNGSRIDAGIASRLSVDRHDHPPSQGSTSPPPSTAPPTVIASPSPPSPSPPPVPPPVAPGLVTRNAAGGFDGETPHFRVEDNHIFILASDGDAERIPTSEAVHHRISFEADDGETRVGDESRAEYSDALIRWRKTVGEYVAAVMFGRADNPAVKDPRRHWEVEGWPEGYSFWVTPRKPKKGRDGDPRVPMKDYYLYGTTEASSFKSPNHFAYHAVWLMRGKPLTGDGENECLCAHCGGRSQKDVVTPELNRIRRVARARARNGGSPAPTLEGDHSGDGDEEDELGGDD